METLDDDILRVPKKLQVPVPDFTIDTTDDDKDNIELWTFRLPANVPISNLNNVVIDLKGNTGNFKVGEQEYNILLGESVENDSFRVLVPATTSIEDSESDISDDDSASDDDDDSDDEEGSSKIQCLQPSSTPFVRHWNVVTSVPNLSETKVAPRVGPKPVDPMRHAYSSIPQRRGLKRRWMPLGAGVQVETLRNANKQVEEEKKSSTITTKKEESAAIAVTPPSKQRKLEEESTETTNDKTKEEKSQPSVAKEKKDSKAERKALKAEKRALKKAKKEAKKAKKEKKKSK